MRFPKRLPFPRRSSAALGNDALANPEVTSGANWWDRTTMSPRLVSSVLALSLIAVGATVYLSPTGGSDKSGLRAAPSPTVTKTETATAPRSPSTEDAAATITPTASAEPKIARPRTNAVVVKTTVSASPKPLYCAQFTWQQDAQAAYEANLSDPWGLDGAPGPNNGNGLACDQGPGALPVQPLPRPASTPVGAFVPPVATAESKTQLTSPSLDYFGVSQNGLPNDGGMFNQLSTTFGKAPSTVGWFQTWDQPFDPLKVQNSWSRGSLPVMTWMSVDGRTPKVISDSAMNLNAINHGDWDAYLYKFAGDVVRTNLPIVIRFDHEMNGNWYPWSQQNSTYTSDSYVKAWRHVHDIFQAVGANEDVIWLWSPGRIDNLNTAGKNLAASYPGDDYVDWVGASVYWRSATDIDPSTGQPDYNKSFGQTIAKIRTLTNKPLFFAEIGAAQSTSSGTDLSAQKSTWMNSTLQGFLADPSIVGFNWFDNVATTPDDPNNPHDWRIDGSAGTLATFKGLIADPRFKSGTMPDGT